MLSVSNAYKTSMAQPLRNCGHIKVQLKLVDQDAQDGGYSPSSCRYFSSQTACFDDVLYRERYATLEKGVTYVYSNTQNRRPRFAPPSTTENPVYQENIFTANSCGTYTFIAQAKDEEDNPLTITCKGLTIDFGHNYPQNIEIRENTSDGTVIYDGTNSDRTFVTTGSISGVTALYIKCSNLISGGTYSRLRVIDFRFGLDMEFTDSDVIDSSYSAVASPICEILPQTDFSVTIKNYDKRFNYDNPDSHIHFLEAGQKVDVQYGYDVDGVTTTWLKKATVRCAGWNVTKNEFTLTAEDPLRNLDSEYRDVPSGKYINASGNVSYASRRVSTIITQIMESLGFESDEYTIASVYNNYYQDYPIAPQSAREILQMLANKCGGTIKINADGQIVFGTNSTSIVDSIGEMDIIDQVSVSQEELIREISVPYVYGVNIVKSSGRTEVVSSEVTVTENEIITFAIGDPADGYLIQIDEADTDIVELVKSGPYYVDLKFLQAGTYDLSVLAYPIVKVDAQMSSVNGRDGSSLSWDNPAIDSKTCASSVLNTVRAYKNRRTVYEFDYRGDPKFEVLDCINQANSLGETVQSQIEELEFTFSGAFHGRLVTRRLT